MQYLSGSRQTRTRQEDISLAPGGWSLLSPTPWRTCPATPPVRAPGARNTTSSSILQAAPPVKERWYGSQLYRQGRSTEQENSLCVLTGRPLKGWSCLVTGPSSGQPLRKESPTFLMHPELSKTVESAVSARLLHVVRADLAGRGRGSAEPTSVVMACPFSPATWQDVALAKDPPSSSPTCSLLTCRSCRPCHPLSMMH